MNVVVGVAEGGARFTSGIFAKPGDAKDAGQGYSLQAALKENR